MYQVFRSLAYIHSLGICHRDIKPQNLVSLIFVISLLCYELNFFFVLVVGSRHWNFKTV
jgi:hypothetical protein